jgi:hypothetical protein
MLDVADPYSLARDLGGRSVFVFLPIRNSEPVFSALNTTTKRISTCRQPTCYYFGEKRERGGKIL